MCPSQFYSCCDWVITLRRVGKDRSSPSCKIRRLEIVNPVQVSSIEYDASTKITGLLQSLLLSQSSLQHTAVSEIHLKSKAFDERFRIGFCNGNFNWLIVLPV